MTAGGIPYFLTVIYLALSHLFQLSTSQQGYGYKDILQGGATFYGDAEGVGIEAGACGYQDLTSAGYGVVIAAGSPPIFKNGKGCGACYRIQCVGSDYCTGDSIIVPITDLCPGGNYCCETCFHFDLSQFAFKKIANLSAGAVSLQYQRVPCSYTGSIKFIVSGNPYWLNILIENVAEDGDIDTVEISSDGGQTFQEMKQSWGANYVYTSHLPSSPLSFRLTSLLSHQVVTSGACLPQNWTPGIYRCGIQFSESPPTSSRTGSNEPPPPSIPPPILSTSPPPPPLPPLPPSSSTNQSPETKGNPPPPKRHSPPPKGKRHSPSPRRHPPPPRNRKRSPPPRKHSPSPRKHSPPPRRHSPPPRRHPPPPRKHSPPPRRHPTPARKRPPPPRPPPKHHGGHHHHPPPSPVTTLPPPLPPSPYPPSFN